MLRLLPATMTNQLATKQDITGLQLTTKQDISELRIEMRELKIDLVKWMVGIALVLGAMIIGILVKLLAS